MRLGRLAIVILAGAGIGAAGEWELGGFGGFGFVRDLGVSGARGTATTGFEPGLAAGVVAGHNMYSKLSGEIRYTFRDSNLQLSSGGTNVSFSGLSHIVHYDLVVHTSRGRSSVQPFVAGGGGIRVFQGTGKEQPFQPLGNIAVLTKTQETKPLVSVGGGVKYAISERVQLRVEMRDYISPFPKEVIAPMSGAKISGWVHDFTPLAGISYTF